MGQWPCKQQRKWRLQRRGEEGCTLRVLSLLPLTSRRLSDDQAIWYTGPT